jgi:hypothetical protein
MGAGCCIQDVAALPRHGAQTTVKVAAARGQNGVLALISDTDNASATIFTGTTPGRPQPQVVLRT